MQKCVFEILKMGLSFREGISSYIELETKALAKALAFITRHRTQAIREIP